MSKTTPMKRITVSIELSDLIRLREHCVNVSAFLRKSIKTHLLALESISRFK